MSDLGKAYVQIVPSAQGISGQISGILDGPATEAGNSAGINAGNALVSALKGVIIAAGLGSFLTAALTAGGNLEQSFGGLSTIYGDAAGQAQAFAMQAAQAGISANNYAEQAVSFGAALKQAYGGDAVAAIGAANTAIMDMADNSAKMGTDLGSIQNAYQGFAKGNYTMLDNLKLGYGGTRGEMERLLADAQELTGVEYDIENFGDVIEAIHAVQEALGLTGVAADEAATTLTGSLNAVKASWENVLAALTTGEGLEQAMQNLTTAVSNFANNAINMLSNLAGQLPALIVGLANAIVAQAPEFISAGVQLIGELAVGLANALPEIIGNIPTLFGTVIDAILSVDWGGVGSAIIMGIINGLKAAAGQLWESIRGLASSALQQLKDELGIGSPSRVFADEVGRWIPAGISLGIEDNLAPIDAALGDLTARTLGDFNRFTRPGALASPAAGSGAIDYDRLAAAISSRPVVIQGDTDRIFRVVRQTNNVRTRATNYNALGAMV